MAELRKESSGWLCVQHEGCVVIVYPQFACALCLAENRILDLSE